MAEFVDLNLEEMIPELEQMQRVELFTEQEVKAIVKKRRGFEYKLKKHTKSKEDILKYIQYEINLLTLLKLRRQKTGYSFKKPEIDHAIGNRINKLFFYAEARFPSDLKIWLSHIEFCKKLKWIHSISRLFVRLLAVKNNEPSLWIMAAKWEFEENHSAINGRGLLLRALRFHPESIHVYTEAFRLELLEADRLRKRRQVLGLSCEEDLPEDADALGSILDGSLAVLFYNDAKNKVKSAADVLPFLTVAKEFDFTQNIQESILSDMKEEHSEDPITWDTMARMALEKKPDESGEKKMKLIDRIEACCSIYEEAVGRIETKSMWELYIDTLFDLSQNQVIKPKIRQKIHNVCHRALTSQTLSVKHAIQWATMLETDPFSGFHFATIMEEAVKQYPKNNVLWIKLLKAKLEKKEEEPLFQIDTGVQSDEEMSDADLKKSIESAEIPVVFWEAIKALGPTSDSIPVWDAAIDHFEALGPKNTDAVEIVKELYEKALVVEPPVGNHFKTRYLYWIATTKGRDEAHKFYQSQATIPPFVVDFHYKMMDIELEKENPNNEVIRRIFEKTVMQFGQKDHEVWLRYIRFELESGDATRLGSLHSRAKATLDSAQADEFLTQYTLLQLNLNKT